ncbi:MAG: alpha-glucan family phosphorylase [Deltaproteobacteria bacterium]|nr:alpha-glucan family phosphorylase [Deltaproteobacteria bacterium]MBW2069649.1 alpha-glucan family phosphorylase [Deltaproteobacteria bacterium]
MKIAYLTMEIGLNENIPTYSGGLGILAGDHIKSAADLGVPLVAVTLLYKRGYFVQNISPMGWQEELYPYFDPRAFMEPLPLKVKVPINGRQVKVGVWKYSYHGLKGKVPIYFLDADLEDNTPDDRLITQYLYGGDQHTRICQEAILGIGGYQALKRLEDNITTYHINEGHSAFVTLSLYHDCRGELERVKEMCVFTTHTPVPAGHDVFAYDLAEDVLGTFLPKEIRELAGKEGLNMTRLALNLSRACNGVSELHGQVTRQMFPGYDIGHITNGVHHLTWTGPEYASLYDQFLPHWRSYPEVLGSAFQIPDELLVEAKLSAKSRLIRYVNATTNAGFSEEFLTVGFARRAASYKRATLFFTDMERLFNLTRNRVQFIFAGKAHPQDEAGKKLIQDIVRTTQRYEGRLRLVYLMNYNMWQAAFLTQGVDLWLNNPRRPREASGTSGMKVTFNGGINMSVLDGWWREACRNRVNGWAIGDDEETSDEETAADFYAVLEEAVTTYYANRRQWVRMMKASISDCASRFNTQRMVQEYLDKYYR